MEVGLGPAPRTLGAVPCSSERLAASDSKILRDMVCYLAPIGACRRPSSSTGEGGPTACGQMRGGSSVGEMRGGAADVVDGAGGRECGDHLCAVYRSGPERDALIESYVHAAQVAGRKPTVLNRHEVPAAYADRHANDPDALTADFERHAADAVAEGYSGWAVVVDGTELVLTPESRASFARWEHLADRMFRSSATITALCVYDGDELGTEVAAEMGVLHQRTLPDDTPFHLTSDDEGVRLDGELDPTTLSLLDSAFAAVTSTIEGDVVVDVSQLQFVDHRSLRVLDRHAETHGKRVVLRSGKPIVARLIDLIGVSHMTATAA